MSNGFPGKITHLAKTVIEQLRFNNIILERPSPSHSRSGSQTERSTIVSFDQFRSHYFFLLRHCPWVLVTQKQKYVVNSEINFRGVQGQNCMALFLSLSLCYESQLFLRNTYSLLKQHLSIKEGIILSCVHGHVGTVKSVFPLWNKYTTNSFVRLSDRSVMSYIDITDI